MFKKFVQKNFVHIFRSLIVTVLISGELNSHTGRNRYMTQILGNYKCIDVCRDGAIRVLRDRDLALRRLGGRFDLFLFNFA